MERFFLLSHTSAGTIVLILGLVNFLNRKGGKYHTLLGKVYVGSMWWICLSALLIIIFHRFSFFLMVIAVLTFYASFVGVRVVNRKKPGTERWYDWAASILTGLFGLGLILYGIILFVRTSGFTILGLLCLLFGFFSLNAGVKDLQFFRKKNPVNDKKWWLYQHVSAIGGSYIAAVTAFAVQNGEIFLPDSSMSWLLWVLPTVIGSPVIALINRKNRKINQLV